MNPRRIAAAALIAWLVSIPLGTFIDQESWAASTPAIPQRSGPTWIASESCPSDMSFS